MSLLATLQKRKLKHFGHRLVGPRNLCIVVRRMRGRRHGLKSAIMAMHGGSDGGVWYETPSKKQGKSPGLLQFFRS